MACYGNLGGRERERGFWEEESQCKRRASRTVIRNLKNETRNFN